MHSNAKRNGKKRKRSNNGSPSKKATSNANGTANGKSKKTSPNSVKKKKEKGLDPRLAPIKRLVEGQNNETLQSLLFLFAEKSLLSIMEIHKKREGSLQALRRR